MSGKKGKVVLAYSGGLDTSVAIKWIPEKYNMDVITVTIDLGAVKDLEGIRQKALGIGAKKAIVVDAKETFVKYFIYPALQAGALYEGVYPLATALGRPLIAKLLADVAHEEKADAVAHGCTGKGNDQVRLDVSLNVLNPNLQIIAPVREWRMTRDEEIKYAEEHNIPVEAKIKSPYSTDENLWGRSIECGVLEDPWAEPPEEVYKWTKNAKETPDEPEYLEIHFDRGIPVAINNEEMDGITIINTLNARGGKHGVGRIDHLENRLVGIKSREIYEAPAAIILHTAHRALEGMIMTKDALRFKEIVSTQYADLIYNGLWFSAFHQDLVAYVMSSQRIMNGTIRVRLSKGTCTVVGRKSPLSLYSEKLATYQKEDTFDHSASVGFIKIYGLPVKIQAQKQMDVLVGRETLQLDSIMPPKLKSVKASEK
ncbi:MAG TPA: argininosuccinate synthase [Candidatus Wujingus californicus]|uniref:argininosuccinate synthase n=1 Tax=Candidatus Wujingus californicus TaxID=3367618 RepID=UPI001DAAC182|nr:argininosuccinate synthase [Planctomycetota bacterium]MDO8130906.1 argininosuccinate synthase [Candidatus Brocadiales bacterium]